MEENIKIGDIYEIHCYKHNGKIDRISGEAIVLEDNDDYLVCANNKVKLTENDGRSHRTKEIAIYFFVGLIGCFIRFLADIWLVVFAID